MIDLKEMLINCTINSPKAPVEIVVWNITNISEEKVMFLGIKWLRD